MYTTLRFKNGINADILKDEVYAWSWGLDGYQQIVCIKPYHGDDELIQVLDSIRLYVNMNKHDDINELLFTEFNKEGDSITYGENGGIIVKAGNSHFYDEFNAIISRLKSMEGVSVGKWELLDGEENDGKAIFYRPIFHLGCNVAAIYSHF